MVRQLTPFELLFRTKMLNGITLTQQPFSTVEEQKLGQPVDIYEDESGLVIEVACVGADKKDVKVTVQREGRLLSFSVVRPENNDKDEVIEKIKSRKYIHRNISRKDFGIDWKVSPRFDLSGVTAEVDKGLLTIRVPVAEEKSSEVSEIEIQ